ADEHVRGEVVAEQERGVAVRRREEPRAAVVQEVRLVDRLEPEREARLGEQREDGLGLALVRRPERRAPERALALRLERDNVPKLSGSRQRPLRCGRRRRRW